MDIGFGLVVGTNDGVARLASEVVEVRCRSIILVNRTLETTASKEIEARLGELGADLIILVALLGMGVLRSRSSVVHWHRGHDTHSPTLVMQLRSHTIGRFTVGCLTDHAIVGFLARSEACACCCGIGDAIGSRESGSLSRIRELAHEQWHTIDLTLESRLVHLSG